MRSRKATSQATHADWEEASTGNLELDSPSSPLAVKLELSEPILSNLPLYTFCSSEPSLNKANFKLDDPAFTARMYEGSIKILVPEASRRQCWCLWDTSRFCIIPLSSCSRL